MVTYRAQKERIENILNGAVKFRGNCPFCHGKNTLSITRTDGALKWKCFSASCDVQGREDNLMTAEEITKKFLPAPTNDGGFTIPSSWVHIGSHPELLTMLGRYNSSEAYAKHAVDLRYDMVEDRLVFLLKDQDKVTGGIGRSLSRNSIPKWKVFGTKPGLFHVNPLQGESDIAIVTEDAFSACSVSRVAHGIALLGTNLQDGDLVELSRFRKVYVALDPDATGKALTMVMRLSYYTQAGILLLEDDPKNIDKQTLTSSLRGAEWQL